MNASLTSQCISSRRVSAGSASLQVDHNPCSFVSAHRSGEHGAVGGGRSRSTPEGHTAWPSSASRSLMLQSRLWSSLRPVTSAHSKLRARTPPALHHCLAEAVVINFSVRHRGRRVQAIFHASPVGQPLLLCGAAFSKRFWCRLHSRWATPRQPVRCSGSATTHMRALSHLVLSARCAGAFSRPPSIHPTIKGSQMAYGSAYTRWCAARGRAWSFRGARSPRSRRKHLACGGDFVHVCARTVARDHCGARGSS